jgi:hypothetical protein
MDNCLGNGHALASLSWEIGKHLVKFSEKLDNIVHCESTGSRGQPMDNSWNAYTGTWNAYTGTWNAYTGTGNAYTGTWTGGSKIVRIRAGWILI